MFYQIFGSNCAAQLLQPPIIHPYNRDDPKAEIIFSDAMAWFIERFGDDSKALMHEDEKFDVVIMDAL
jgi:spermidine synthase